VGAVAGFALLAAVDPTFRTGNNLPLFNVVGFACLGALSVSIIGTSAALPDGIVRRALRHRWLRAIGTVSYCAYVFHDFCIMVVKTTGWPLALQVSAALGLTLAIATASWFLLEKPLMSQRHRVRL
jgi:peptidoglycan/LPS O-acetylase OafA/YrhL